MANAVDGFRPGGAAVPATQVEISVSCRNLQDKDTFSKSDPMCVLYAKDFGVERWHEEGRTEMIKDTLNPEFVKKFTMQYYFEQMQKLRFDIYDVDSPSGRLDAHDFLGRCECSLGEIIGSPGSAFVKNLVGAGRRCGTITVSVEEVSNCKDVITLQLKGTNLDKKDFFGKSDPYLVFYRSNENNSFTKTHQTEVIKNTLNPTWRPFTVPVRALCNGDHDRLIKIQCYDWDSDGGHDYIGEFSTTIRELKEGPGSRNIYECINPKKKAKKKSYKNSGQIHLLSCRIEAVPSFLDFVHGGMQINFTVAVDFTASNGDPRTPSSLHYINPYHPNQYALALGAVGEIIQDYDSDKMFPALGFGARLPPNGMVSHEFFLNGKPNDPYCAGIGGVMEAYHRTLQTVQLYGPTNFAPVINHVAKFASAYQDGSNYFVLLIITDGVISDMPYTKEAIVNAAGLPMSIIIVGVGPAEFDAMDELDGDNVRLSSRGRYAERDIVQFVPFRDFIGGKYGQDTQVSKAHLAKEVLAEIPDQIVGYMRKRGIQPKPPPPPNLTAPPPPPAGETAPPATAPPPAYAPPAGGYGQPSAPPGGGYGYSQAPPGGGYAPPGGGGYPPSGGYQGYQQQATAPRW